jgi:hypothetical protein
LVFERGKRGVMKRVYLLVIEETPGIEGRLSVTLKDTLGEVITTNHPRTSRGIGGALEEIGEALVIYQDLHRDLPPDGR